MTTMREKVKHILKNDADRIADAFEEMAELYPEQIEQMVNEFYYGCHIRDEMLYNKAVAYFDNYDGTKGAKWAVDEIVKSANSMGIDFEEKEYYEYDYCYVVNMFYSDYCNVFTEKSYYMKMAKNYLEDKDYCGDPSERAYKNAKKRIRYNQSK